MPSTWPTSTGAATLVLEAVAACKAERRARGRASLAELRWRFPKSPAIAEVVTACE